MTPTTPDRPLDQPRHEPHTAAATRRPHVAGTGVVEDGVPDWVYRRFAPPDLLDEPDAAEPSAAVVAGLSDLVHAELVGSGYPLQHVTCRCEGADLVLSGFVARYFHVQMALQAVRRVAGSRRIRNDILVLPTQERAFPVG